MKLKFNSNLYTKEAIDAAVAMFKDFAKIKVAKTKAVYNVTFTGIDEEFTDSLPGEFSNCALMAMQGAQ